MQHIFTVIVVAGKQNVIGVKYPLPIISLIIVLIAITVAHQRKI